MSFYSDDKFGVIERHWFGLTKKVGGDAASGFTFGTTDATTKVHVTRFYPKGPIAIKKIGALVLASIYNTSNASLDQVPVKFLTRGASASVCGTFSLDVDGGTIAPYTIASNSSPTVAQVKAGEYITIKTATPQTDKGTAANTATTNGSVAFFIDYVRTFDPSGKWDV